MDEKKKSEASGATALVRKHSAEEGAAPRKDWRVRLGSRASRGYSPCSSRWCVWPPCPNPREPRQRP